MEDIFYDLKYKVDGIPDAEEKEYYAKTIVHFREYFFDLPDSKSKIPLYLETMEDLFSIAHSNAVFFSDEEKKDLM